MEKIGTRVGAVQKANYDTVYLYGYGVYDGDLPCPLLGEIPNPHIALDNGKEVWGCECWWGNEEKMKKWIGDRAVVTVDTPPSVMGGKK